MTFLAFVYPYLRAPKDVVREVFKKSRFRRPFDKVHGKRSQKQLKSEDQDLSHIYWSMWRQLSRKKSLLVICKALGLFINSLTAHDNYSLFNRDNLTEPIQM